MGTILDTIIDQKRKEVELLRSTFTIKDFEQSIYFNKKTISLKEKLENKFGIIAEFKRKSPSAGVINNELDPIEIGKIYEQNGASAISVLTDSNFFGAKETDIIEIRKTVQIPILRKDFIIDEFQLIQAKAMGADVVLLIAEALSEQEILQFTILAQDLGLEVICEFHEKNQLSKISELVDIIGVNNRNLKTQTTTIQTSLDAIEFLPKNKLLITESGIKSKEDLELLASVGYNGALIGESILKSNSITSFINTLNYI